MHKLTTNVMVSQLKTTDCTSSNMNYHRFKTFRKIKCRLIYITGHFWTTSACLTIFHISHSCYWSQICLNIKNKIYSWLHITWTWFDSLHSLHIYLQQLSCYCTKYTQLMAGLCFPSLKPLVCMNTVVCLHHHCTPWLRYTPSRPTPLHTFVPQHMSQLRATSIRSQPRVICWISQQPNLFGTSDTRIKTTLNTNGLTWLCGDVRIYLV